MRGIFPERLKGVRFGKGGTAVGDDCQRMIIARSFDDPDRFDPIQLSKRFGDRLLAAGTLDPRHASPVGDISGESGTGDKKTEEDEEKGKSFHESLTQINCANCLR